MTIAPPPRTPVRDADLDASIARLHLRVGMLSIAHAELEELDARSALDAEGRLALAEARWRTGDLEGASEAANAYLRSGGSDPIALVIAAESAAASGRPSEARAAIARLGPVDASALDALFAGMPRRAFWPSAPNAPVEAETLFDVERPASAPRPGSPDRAAGRDGGTPARETATRAMSTRGDQAASPTASSSEVSETGFWDADAGPGAPPSELASESVDPAVELDAARAELAIAPESAALRLAIVLRLDPTLAPQVLEAIQARSGAAFEIVRGDGQRLLGRHLEAEASYTAAARAVEAAARQLR